MSHRVTRWCAFALAVLLVAPAVGGQWRLYEFSENEHFRYEVKQTEDGETTTGHYALKVKPVGDGKLKIEIDARLGEDECSANVTVESAEAVPQQMMTGCMMLRPVLMAIYTPAMGYFTGRSFAVGDNWSMNQGGESISFSVERECTHAGQTGKLAVMRQNDEIRMQSCVAERVPLPIAGMWNMDPGQTVAIELVQYGK